MHDLGRVVARGFAGKEPLPDPFEDWGKRGIHIYPGSLHLYAGIAGTYKSMVVTQAIINMGLPTFIFSTDSDNLTVASRLLANATGKPATETRKMAIEEPDIAADILGNRFGFIKWSFETDLTGDGIWHSLYAYATRYGEFPRQIVIDILSDVVFEDAESEWAALRKAMKQFNVVARETTAAVHLVHHATEGFRTTDLHPCPSRADIMGKDSKHPVVIMTFGKDSRGDLHAACVKNRHGEADASGKSSFRMHVDPSTSRVQDFKPHHVQAPVPTGHWGGWGGDDGEEDDG